MQYHRRGELGKAASQYLQILRNDPDESRVWHLLGTLAYQSKKYEDAGFLIQKAIDIRADAALYHYDLALVYVARKRSGRALKALETSISLDPQFAQAFNLQGRILQGLDHMDEAISKFRHCLQLNPDSAQFWFDLGNACKKASRLEKAVESFKKATLLKRDYFQAFNNIGNTFRELGRHAEAIRSFEKALKINPEYAEAAFNRALVRLGQGDYRNGWKGFEQRLKVPSFKAACPETEEVPQWDGTPFVGKELFVWDEQGMGDTLQFIRYIPMAKSLGGKIIFETDEALIELLNDFPGIDSLKKKPENGQRRVSGDFHISLLSLPAVFSTSLTTIPNAVPYLFADPLKSEIWRNRVLEDPINIGVVWSGNPMHPNDQNRSCKMSSFAPLARLEHIQVYGLQKGEAVSQASTLPSDISIDNLDSYIKNFADTAAIIDNLDLVISVDTSVAHLAGAMGKPVWVLLPAHLPDWRWLLDCKASPWYPNMRLFRQPRRGDWEGVMSEIVETLLDPKICSDFKRQRKQE